MYKIYSKESLNRFGDDLLELVLSYHSFDDCFRFECLSKQCQRLVFNKQNKLIINEDFVPKRDKEGIGLKRLKAILKKCSNITHIVVDEGILIVEEVFEVIIKYAESLRQIECNFIDFSEDLIQEFCQKFGSKLNSIKFNVYNDKNRSVLPLCPALTALDLIGCKSTGISMLFSGEKILYTRLKKISFNYSPKTHKMFETLIESNKKSLQSVDVRVGQMPGHSLLALLKGLSELPELKSLSINNTSDISICDSNLIVLSQIVTTCEKLRKLNLKFRSGSEYFFARVYNTFRCLKIIHLDYTQSHFYLNIICEAKDYDPGYFHFTHDDTIIYHGPGAHWYRTVNAIQNRFFKNIGKYLPNLQTISIDKCGQSREVLESMSILKDITVIQFLSVKFNSNTSNVMKVIKNCPKLESIVVKHVRNGTQIDLNIDEIYRLKTFGLKASGVTILRTSIVK